MPYRTQIGPRASQQINGWGLAEPVFMEVLLHLYETLAANPHARLTSLPNVPDGMFYYLRLADSGRSDLAHEFIFQVKYLADEQHLLVLRGSYWRHIDGPA